MIASSSQAIMSASSDGKGSRPDSVPLSPHIYILPSSEAMATDPDASPPGYSTLVGIHDVTGATDDLDTDPKAIELLCIEDKVHDQVKTSDKVKANNEDEEETILIESKPKPIGSLMDVATANECYRIQVTSDTDSCCDVTSDSDASDDDDAAARADDTLRNKLEVVGQDMSKDRGDGGGTADDSDVMFEGFLPVVFRFMKQTTPPRRQCLRLITSPYPFAKHMF